VCVRLLDGIKDIGISVKKFEDFAEWYLQAVLKAGLIDYAPIKGFIVLRPYGYEIWNIIRETLDNRLRETGHQNGFLPVVIPESLIAKEKSHFAGFNPEVFWVTETGSNLLSERLALRPTSETIAYSTFSKWINSYRDLPLKMNYWNSALRADIKGTKPFIRNSEFLWQEGHTVHSSEYEAKDEVQSILRLYHELIQEYLAIPCISGLKSEKEKFVGAEYTMTLESIMGDGKALQMATSHNLGQNFSKTFEIKYLGRDNKEHFAWQTSWGLSWRLIGAIVMVHGDDKGIILPPRIAPIQVIIIPIFKDKDADKIKSKARETADELKNVGLRVQVDDRDEYTSGWKFNEWELKGVPLRINIGKREMDKDEAELIRRDTMKKFSTHYDNLASYATDILDDIQGNLFIRARKLLDQNLAEATTYTALKSILANKGGLVLCGWCQNQECELEIKEETGADIRVIPFDWQDLSKFSNCIYCGRQSKRTVIFAHAY
jgi:prolyl-tRNA synthetase